MKQQWFNCMFACAVLVISICGYAQDPAHNAPDYDAIATKIVNYSLDVQPGEVVLISGTPAELEVLRALSYAVAMAGGQPTVEISFPGSSKKAMMDMPMEYLKQFPSYQYIKIGTIDCLIDVLSTQDPDLFTDVPEERMAAVRQVSMPLNEAFMNSRIRQIALGQVGGIPTQTYAESTGADYEEMLRMFWASIDADYDEMQKKATAISGILKPASEVRITNDWGTNLTFKIGNLPSRISCGRCADNTSASGRASTWLPAGEVFATIDPKSATGTVVIPKYSYRGQDIINLRLDLSNGRISSMTADKNIEVLQESMDLSTGDKDVLSAFDIGLNPKSHPLEGSDYYSWEMAGIVTLVIGNNLWTGGDIVSDISFAFHQANANVTVGGNPVVTGGNLE